MKFPGCIKGQQIKVIQHFLAFSYPFILYTMETSEQLAVLLVAHHTIDSLFDLNSQLFALSTAAIIECLLRLDHLAKSYPQLKVVEPNAGERLLIASWWISSTAEQKWLLEKSMLVTSMFQGVKGGVREAGEELNKLIDQSGNFRLKNVTRRVGFSCQQLSPSIDHFETPLLSPSIDHFVTPPLSPELLPKRFSPPNFCRPLFKFVDFADKPERDLVIVNHIGEEELFHAL